MFNNLLLIHNPKTWKPDAVLLTVAQSNFMKDKKAFTHYANKGDGVKLISTHGNTVIAENSKGVRFAIAAKSIQVK